MELVAGIDLATSEVRALAVDATGRRHAETSAPLPPSYSPRPGWCEQDAGAWWPATVATLTQLAGQLGTATNTLVAVSVCATSGTVLALDDDLQPIGPAVTYADQRAVCEAEAAHRAAATRWARLGLRVQPSFGLPKWGWLLRHADIGARVSRLAHASDVLVAQLVGAPPASDWSHALKSGYDPQRREWASEALAALGIAPRLLPEILPPAEVAGRVTRSAAQATGLPSGCEVRLGMTDGCAAQLAADAARPGRLLSVLGSTLVLKGASHSLVADPAGAVYSHRHPQGWWLPGGASSTGGAALEAAFPGRDLAVLDEMAAHHGPARAVVYPLGGRGERFPFTAGDAEGFELGEIGDEVARHRALLEGVAFVERLAVERLRTLGVEIIPPVVVGGRGSTSRTWNRIRAAVLGLPLLAKPHAPTALGACMLAATGTLHPDLAAATAAMSPPGEPIGEDGPAEDPTALDTNYRRFLTALADRGWWRESTMTD